MLKLNVKNNLKTNIKYYGCDNIDLSNGISHLHLSNSGCRIRVIECDGDIYVTMCTHVSTSKEQNLSIHKTTNLRDAITIAKLMWKEITSYYNQEEGDSPYELEQEKTIDA